MKVLISQPIPPHQLARLSTYNINYDILTERYPNSTLDEQARNYDVLVTMLSDQIDHTFLQKNSHLKLIANYAVGYNNIDLSTANKLRIKISNTPDVLTNATADIALTLLLASSRLLLPAYQNVQQGQWQGWEPLGFLGKDLYQQTLGIFGAGRIGQLFAQKCQQLFSMKIIYHSRSKKMKFEHDTAAQQVSFDNLLQYSDVLSLHAPLTPQTENLMNEHSFSRMKPDSIFINTARGKMHNESALLKFINDGHLFAAGLDVTNPEPMPSSANILSNPRIIVLPHIGSATRNTRDAMVKIVVDNIIALYKNNKLPTEITSSS